MKPDVQILQDGVVFMNVPDTRFTTAQLCVSFYVPLAMETAGTMAMLPALLRRGCRQFPDRIQLGRKLDRLYGAGITEAVVRAGEAQALTLTLSCLDDRFVLDGKSVLAEAVELLSQLVFDPPLENGVFRAEDVEQERRCALEAIAAEINDKRRYALEACRRLLCQGEPYAVPLHGVKEQVETVTADVLTAAWREVLETAPVQIVYQGAQNGLPVAKAFAERFTGRQVKVLPPIVSATAKPAVAEQHEQMDVNQCQLVLGFRTDVTEDHPLADALRLAVTLLGGTAHSLLFMNVREKYSLCYYCAASVNAQKGTVVLDSGVEPDKLGQAKQEMLHQVERLKAGEFTDDDLENARRSLMDTLLSYEDSASSFMTWYTVRGPGAASCGPRDMMESIRQVTREQVLAAANTLTPDCVYTLTPKEETT